MPFPHANREPNPKHEPTLDEILAWWNPLGPDGPPSEGEVQEGEVWLLYNIFLDQPAYDALGGPDVYESRTAALWAYWADQHEYTSDPDYFSGSYSPTQWLVDTLTALQLLRDEGAYPDGCDVTCLQKRKVNR